MQMAPLSLWFQRNPATREAAGGKLQRAGKLVMSANHAIKVMVSGVETPPQARAWPSTAEAPTWGGIRKADSKMPYHMLNYRLHS